VPGNQGLYPHITRKLDGEELALLLVEEPEAHLHPPDGT